MNIPLKSVHSGSLELVSAGLGFDMYLLFIEAEVIKVGEFSKGAAEWRKFSAKVDIKIKQSSLTLSTSNDSHPNAELARTWWNKSVMILCKQDVAILHTLHVFVSVFFIFLVDVLRLLFFMPRFILFSNILFYLKESLFIKAMFVVTETFQCLHNSGSILLTAICVAENVFTSFRFKDLNWFGCLARWIKWKFDCMILHKRLL